MFGDSSAIPSKESLQHTQIPAAERRPQSTWIEFSWTAATAMEMILISLCCRACLDSLVTLPVSQNNNAAFFNVGEFTVIFNGLVFQSREELLSQISPSPFIVCFAINYKIISYPQGGQGLMRDQERDARLE